MAKPFEYVTREDGMVSAIADGREVTLREAVSMTAMSLYEKLLLASAEVNADEKKRLEEKIIFQSRALDSLSNAYSDFSVQILMRTRFLLRICDTD